MLKQKPVKTALVSAGGFSFWWPTQAAFGAVFVDATYGLVVESAHTKTFSELM